MSDQTNNVSDIWLSIIVPVHNEGPSLERVLRGLDRLTCSLAPRKCEIIVVDDGCDRPATMPEPMATPLRLFRHETRCGSGSARKTGTTAARGERIAWIDADATYDPQSLLPLLEALDSADQVVGSRSIDFGRLRWLRLGTKRLSFLLASLLWWRWIPDLNSGLRAFHRHAVQSWISELPAGFSCTSTATLASLNHGQTIRFVPVPYFPRVAGTASKFHPIADTFRLWRTIIRMRLKRGVR